MKRPSRHPRRDLPPAALEIAERQIKHMASEVEKHAPDGYGYILFLMSFGEGGQATYVSTIERADAIRSLEEWLERQRVLNPKPGEFVDETALACWLCGKTGARLTKFTGALRTVTLCRDCQCTGQHADPSTNL